jgi:hypothetical protein
MLKAVGIQVGKHVHTRASFWLRWSEFDALRAQKYADVYDQSAIAD